MKFVKITLRNKKVFTLPADQAEQVLDSSESLIKISEGGKWNGLTINKADIVATEPDHEAEREWKLNHEKQLPAPELSAQEKERVEAIKQEIRVVVSGFDIKTSDLVENKNLEQLEKTVEEVPV